MEPKALEVLIIAVVVSLASLPLLALVPFIRRSRLGSSAIAVGVIAAAGFAFAAVRLYPPLTAERDVPDRPVQDLRSGYVSSKTCKSCHPHEYDTWYASYHRTMTQLATPESVAADFDDIRLEVQGRRYHLQIRGDELWVTMDDSAWNGRGERPPQIERRIVMTTGSHHDQNYWYTTPGEGRDLRLMPLDYRIGDKKWVSYISSFMQPPNSSFHFSRGNWTHGCVKCHTTYGEVSIDPTTNQIDSRVAELGIACEACHGPGGRHVEANRDPQRRYQLHLAGEPDPTIVNPENLTGRRSAQICGQCHGQWIERKDGSDLVDSENRYKPGDQISDGRMYLHYNNAEFRFDGVDPQMEETVRTLQETNPGYFRGKFWPDGMIRVSGREYTGLLESPCFQAGDLSCLSCHTMHQSADDHRPLSEWTNDQLSPGQDGNDACLQCHPKFRTPETLTAHTHHAANSTGSSCYNCHMPFTSYGILKAHRSHQVDSPSVAVSLETGRPNACNLCHLDKTLAWTAEQLETRYEIPQPELDADHDLIAASVLWTLRGDAGQRALMAWHMGWGPAIAVSGSDWMVPFLSQLMVDPYDAVRYMAGRSLGGHAGYENLDYDYIAGRAHTRRTAGQVRQRWSQAVRESRGPEVLQGTRGRLQFDVYKRLISAQDKTPFFLNE